MRFLKTMSWLKMTSYSGEVVDDTGGGRGSSLLKVGEAADVGAPRFRTTSSSEKDLGGDGMSFLQGTLFSPKAWRRLLSVAKGRNYTSKKLSPLVVTG